MLNRITIMGRFTRDPELRYTQSETAVAGFTLAVERDAKDSDGARVVDFIDCVAWKQKAEFASKYFRKGSLAVVSGRLQFREWTDSNNNKRRNAEVYVENIYFAEKKERTSAFSEISDEDGELPF